MSSYRTRSRTSTLAESVQEQATDSGLQSAPRAPHSPTMLPRRGTEDQLTPRRPATDEGQGACRKEDSRSSRTSVVSRLSRKAAQLRLEYEAEAEIVKLKERLIAKKNAMIMAEMEAEEEERKSNHSVSSRSRVERWVEDASVTTRLQPRADLAPLPLFEDTMGEHHVGERAISPPPPTPLRLINEQRSDERLITCLTEALQNIARPRPMPRQFYELPSFSGRPEEWLLFKKKYDDTTVNGGYTASDNIARLQSALQGEAKLAVEDLLVSCTDPVVIVSALERQFGHPTVILKSALDKVRKLNKLSDNSVSDICKFYNVVRNCVAVLKTLGAECYVNNPQVIEEIVSKFTTLQRVQYSEYLMNIDKERNLNLCIVPDLNIVVEFLERLTKAASYIMPVESSSTRGVLSSTTRARPSTSWRAPPLPAPRAPPPRPAHRVHVQAEADQTKDINRQVCYLCNNNSHSLSTCSDFLNMDLSKRWDFIRNKKLCFKCFGEKHSRRFCRSERCKKCNYGHHSLLYVDKDETVLNISVGIGVSKTLLKVLPVDIITDCSVIKTYALLDDGATVSLIDETIVTDVSGPIQPLTFAMAKGHIVKDNGSRCVNINIRGPNNNIHSVRVRTVKDLALPTQSLSADVIRAHRHLADLGCEEMRDARPLLLLGQDNWELIVGRDVRQGKSGRPVASLTYLGWVIHGPVDMSRDGPETINCCIEMHNLIRSQLELVSLGIVEQTRKHRDNDRALEILNNTSQYTVDGWEVGLLWRGNQENIPDNYTYVKNRLHGVEKRMDRDSTYADAYCAQVDRLIENGYAHKVTGGSVSSSPVWYLPHFGVTNPNKPQKLRLVFDAAARYKGVCMNDFLLSGPDMLNSLLGILFRFRSRGIGVTADIADMFLRVRIREQDRGAQLFLWRRKNRDREPDTYMMDSMIFGAASSPTSAIYILNKNAERFIHSHPEAVQAIRRNHYVDDYVHSVENVDEGIKLINDIIYVHQQGNFNIRGWVTSSPQLNQLLSTTTPDKVDMKKLGGGDNERTLGMTWTPVEDRLTFDLSFKRSSAGVVSGEIVPTKREFLRVIMSVFDPLGLLTPIIINSRIIMRDVWKSGIGWDDKLTEPDFVRWQTWLEVLRSVQKLTVPRWYGIVSSEYELHVFGGASEQAYAAVAYLVGKGQDGCSVVALVAGKARVALMKIISIPRLELQAAVLASRLARTVASEHDVHISRRIMWTDNRTVLQWFTSDLRGYKPFVSYRLADVDKLTNVSDWRWLPSSFNPADKATRMGWSRVSSRWFLGPVFLCRPALEWPGRGQLSDCGTNSVRAVTEMKTAVSPLRDDATTRGIDC